MADTQGKPAVAKADKKAREGRSPGFPFIDLNKALERAEEFRLAEGKHSVPVGSANKAWKLSDDSVPARRTIAALGYFGLFEDEGVGAKRKVRLSEKALKILLDKQPDSPERDQLIKEAALAPAIHLELWEKWGPELPSDATFETYLVRDRGFSGGGASDFMAAYKNTLAFAKLGKSDIMSIEPRTDQGNQGMTPQVQTPLKPTMPLSPLPPKPGMRQEIITLDEGDVVLTFPTNLTPESFEDLKAHLDLFIKKMQRRARNLETLMGPKNDEAAN